MQSQYLNQYKQVNTNINQLKVGGGGGGEAD